MTTLSDYRGREHWSYSAMNQFISCSLQFAFQRIYKLKREFTSVSLCFGSAYHRTLEWIFLLRKDGKMPAVKECQDYFRTAWKRQLEGEPDARLDADKTPDDYGEQGAGLIEAYLESLDHDEEVVSISEAFAVPLIDSNGDMLKKPLIGEFDCVVRKGSEPVIVDWKTSARRWPKTQACKSYQATAYSYAYELLHGQNVPLRFDVVVKNKTPIAETHTTRRDQNDFDRMIALIRTIDRMVEAEHFMPNEGSFFCGGCPYQTACQNWHKEKPQLTLPMVA